MVDCKDLLDVIGRVKVSSCNLNVAKEIKSAGVSRLTKGSKGRNLSAHSTKEIGQTISNLRGLTQSFLTISNSFLAFPPSPSPAKTLKHISIIKLSIPALVNSFSPLISPFSTTSINDNKAEEGSGCMNNEDQIELADGSALEEI